MTKPPPLTTERIGYLTLFPARLERTGLHFCWTSLVPLMATAPEAFQGLRLTVIRDARRHHIMPLSRVHQRIFAPLDRSADVYTRLCADSHKPP
jgi:hypothetical protein